MFARVFVLCSFLTVAACDSAPPASNAAGPEAAEPEPTSAQTAEPGSNAIDAAVAAATRSESNVARDGARHPAETLAFFGIEPDMQVLEIWPGGGGWYTEILAPLLADEGNLTVAVIGAGHVDFENERLAGLFTRFNQQFRDKIAADPQTYGGITLTELWAPTELNMVEPGSQDMIVTFHNLHNWLAWGQSEQVLASFYDALKPGGLLGMTDHRATPGKEVDPKATNGYVDQEFAISTIEAAGFEFVAASDVNANPKDTADHPAGVWTLPPTMALGDDNAEHYRAIGESDRLTLLFRKPSE